MKIIKEMKTPIYNLSEIQNIENQDAILFSEFISDFHSQELYENEIENGIVKKVISDGTQSLSKNQLYYVDNIIKRHESKCKICNETISINEVLFTNHCNGHKYLSEEL